MVFDEFDKTFYAYDKDKNKKSISFKHRAADTYFDDGKNMEEKMEELFQYGNDFKKNVADAIVAKGGIASANMSKNEITNAILQLDNVKFSLIDIDIRTLKGNAGWNAFTGTLTPGNIVKLPLFDLVEDAKKLVSLTYVINDHYALPAYIYVNGTMAYYNVMSINMANTNSYDDLFFRSGSGLYMQHSIDTEIQVSLLNDGNKKIIFNRIKAYVVTK